MAKVTYEKEITALLVIDPYNDFISEGGKVWDRLKGVAKANRCVPHMTSELMCQEVIAVILLKPSQFFHWSCTGELLLAHR
jgi:hypothetical protein